MDSSEGTRVLLNFAPSFDPHPTERSDVLFPDSSEQFHLNYREVLGRFRFE